MQGYVDGGGGGSGGGGGGGGELNGHDPNDGKSRHQHHPPLLHQQRSLARPSLLSPSSS